MTRPLHPETRVQRAQSSETASRADRERGYEPADAPPKAVAVGLAALLGLMVLGLLMAALLLRHIENAEDADPPDPFSQVNLPHPEPSLLVHPEEERLRLEAAAHARLARGQMPIEEAMRQMAERGWEEKAPAPSTSRVARAHVGSQQ